jgi:hypothetical protein
MLTLVEYRGTSLTEAREYEFSLEFYAEVDPEVRIFVFVRTRDKGDQASFIRSCRSCRLSLSHFINTLLHHAHNALPFSI